MSKAALLTAALLVGLAVPTSASKPQPVTITALDIASNSGPWSASGTITDEGTWVRLDILVNPSQGRSGHDTVRLMSHDGQSSFIIDNQTHFSGTGGTGEWTVHGGTGRYTGLLGQGSLVFSFNQGNGGVVVLGGQVHY